MRGGRGESIEDGQAAGATGAARIGHHRVVDIVTERVMVTAEGLARGAVSLDDRHTLGQKDEIQGVGIGGGQGASVDLLLKQLLDGAVLNRRAGTRGSKNGRTDA